MINHDTMVMQKYKIIPHLERHENELNALYSIAKILGSDTGQQEMLHDVLDILENQLDMHRGTIMLLSSDGNELVVEALKNAFSEEQRHVKYKRGEGITGKVLQSGKSIVIPRISHESGFQDRIHRRTENAREDFSFLCVPISIGNEVVGTLSVDIPNNDVVVLEEFRRTLSIVASLVAYDVKAKRHAKIQRELLEAENQRLLNALGEVHKPDFIIGNSRAMRDVYQKINQVSKSDTSVLIRGESGTGKELIASAIHYASARANKPFVRVNCAALSETLIESELFGHERGAFTGAMTTRIGRLEEAEGGTVFLDEIGEFSGVIQVKLLRVLQEREFERVGSNKTLHANIRVIAATNKDLEKAVDLGEFRQDLYYRINVFPVFIPPLRDKKDDILLLADHFVEQYSKKMDKTIKRISTSAINMMMAYHWPGNIRELENSIEHAVLLSNDGVIHGHHLPPTLQMPEQEEKVIPGMFKYRIEQLEKDMITDALKRSKGNITAAARELDITPRMIHYKMKKFDIENVR